jgi:hypothetical protein
MFTQLDGRDIDAEALALRQITSVYEAGVVRKEIPSLTDFEKLSNTSVLSIYFHRK